MLVGATFLLSNLAHDTVTLLSVSAKIRNYKLGKFYTKTKALTDYQFPDSVSSVHQKTLGLVKR